MNAIFLAAVAISLALTATHAFPVLTPYDYHLAAMHEMYASQPYSLFHNTFPYAERHSPAYVPFSRESPDARYVYSKYSTTTVTTDFPVAGIQTDGKFNNNIQLISVAPVHELHKPILGPIVQYTLWVPTGDRITTMCTAQDTFVSMIRCRKPDCAEMRVGCSKLLNPEKYHATPGVPSATDYYNWSYIFCKRSNEYMVGLSCSDPKCFDISIICRGLSVKK